MCFLPLKPLVSEAGTRREMRVLLSNNMLLEVVFEVVCSRSSVLYNNTLTDFSVLRSERMTRGTSEHPDKDKTSAPPRQTASSSHNLRACCLKCERLED